MQQLYPNSGQWGSQNPLKIFTYVSKSHEEYIASSQRLHAFSFWRAGLVSSAPAQALPGFKKVDLCCFILIGHFGYVLGVQFTYYFINKSHLHGPLYVAPTSFPYTLT